jgi:hypothetical protein
VAAALLLEKQSHQAPDVFAGFSAIEREGRFSRLAYNVLTFHKGEAMTRKLLLAACAGMMIATAAFAADTKPKTVIHVITIKWKSDATPAQIEQAIKGAEALPSQHAGVTRVWTKPIKKQLPEGYDHVIVMEFASEDALKKYADSAAQKKWYELYMPIREESRTSDITN